MTAAKKTLITAPKIENPPRPREQRLVLGAVADFGKMEWVFAAKDNDIDILTVEDENGYACCAYTIEQAQALVEFLQEVVPLMQRKPSDPTAPLVRYVP